MLSRQLYFLLFTGVIAFSQAATSNLVELSGSIDNQHGTAVEPSISQASHKYAHEKPLAVTVIPRVFLQSVPSAVTITLPDLEDDEQPWPELLRFSVLLQEDEHHVREIYSQVLNTTSETGEKNAPKLVHKIDKLVLKDSGYNTVIFVVEGAPGYKVSVLVIWAWTSLLPALFTLAVAVAIKQVVLALLLGIWIGCTLMYQMNPLTGLLRTFDTYFVGSFMSRDHAAVILFTLLLGGLIGLVQKSGGAMGLANACRDLASTPQRAQLMCWALGVGIFYDDYSCVLITGNALRPIATTVRLSPEKFAYILHSCAMLPSLMPVSSWVGVELGYLQQQLQNLGIQKNAFVVLMETIQYRMYPVLTVVLALLVCVQVVLSLVVLMRDFGPMLDSEREFAQKHDVSNEEEREPLLDRQGPSVPEHRPSVEIIDGNPLEDPSKQRMANALVPFGTVIVVTCIGMVLDGLAKLKESDPDAPHTIVNIISKADSVNALLWASVMGCIVSGTMAIYQRILTLSQVMEALMGGMRDVIEPLIILLLAWALGAVISDINTAGFLVLALAHTLPVWSLPSVVAVMGFVISFATGSAFGTMGVMFPLTVPLAFEASKGDEHVVMLCSAAILGSAVFGNHCSPIADNTVLSALATGCDIGSHFRTTVPYAAMLAIISLLFGFLPCGLWHWYSGVLPLFVSLLVLVGTMVLIGQRHR